jgi:trehalose utilization protein
VGDRTASGAAGLKHFEIRRNVWQRFDPAPRVSVLQAFQGGEVFLSGCCYQRGLGKIFYFRPGHETYPTYYQKEVLQVIANAVTWAAPAGAPPVTFGNRPPLEPL